ncbi:sulfite exporter TauE/SafE family protein 2-like isoform X1 [Salvia hispanica]|uniref:sulfite exporter TauE/SafE family protein 2-like isoform X1 n=1 Tax=Salvia hispanica TaxID=49212 RepID=UPI002009A064|nr:sulfite exporter TauE/SafE family protein 2-like isoform X1 [Salvia hispanica]
MNHKFPTLVFLLLLLIIFTTTFDTSHAKPKPKPPQIFPISFQFHQTLNSTKSWLQFNFKPSSQSLLAATLSFLAAAVSSAGGIGGGGLFIPILTIAAGVDLKTASSFSAFMVSGGSLANVGCHLLSRRPPLIDYDIALLSEPCMLLGVSAGVILNVVLPEWLITASFAVFLAFCTFKTCAAGVSFWSVESRRRSEEDEEEGGDRKVALLLREEESGGDSHLVGIPWGKVGMLILIWFSFFVLYLLRGNSSGQGIINIESCGKGYWLISSIQIPLALIFTTWILHFGKNAKITAETQEENGVGRRCSSSRKLFFPLMALLAGVLGGVFGIGGGMLISPLLLQIGIEPQATAATCSFMVFFSSIMSAMQYLLLGMEHVDGALGYAAICFIASLVGLTIARRAVMKHGRASLIVFAVGVVMALSTVLITGFGAVEVWNDYTSGESMGFKKPC